MGPNTIQKVAVPHRVVPLVTWVEKSALWQSAVYLLYFNPNDSDFDFDNRNLSAGYNYSGGLLFVG